MPRIFFTGRRKIDRGDVSVLYRPGRPPEFQATIDLSKHSRRLPPSARVIVEAFHNTMLQRFDFGTVADCRPREPLSLTNFDEWDRPRFRVLVIGEDPEPGVLLAACDNIDVVDPEMTYSGGRSMLKLVPKPDREMNGELWKLVDNYGAYELWYNRDVSRFADGIRGKDPAIRGLVLPSVIREILARTHLWGEFSAEATDWTAFAISLCGEGLPTNDDGSVPSTKDVEDWIDRVVAAFCRNRGRFVERIAALEDQPS